MSSMKKIGLIGGLILFMLLLVWLFSAEDATETTVENKYYSSSNWEVKFMPFDKDPRGTYLFHRILQTHIGKNDLYVANTPDQLDSILHMNRKPKTYLFVGNIFGMESKLIDSVYLEIQKGSDLFLSFHQITENITEKFFDELDFRSDYDDNQFVYTPRGKYQLYNFYQKDTVAFEWLAFGDVATFGNSRSLSSFMEMDNFIEIDLRKGKAYFHTNPNMFYNYQLKRNDGFRYTRYVVDYLPQNQDVVLLELGRMPDNQGAEDTDDQTGPEGKKDDSYLKFLLQDPYLRTALLLLIAGVILYVIFRSRRKRPTVPFIGKKKDMTLAFAETITSIYFAKRNPYGLLQVQRKNFYANIQKHFFVDLNRREGDRELIILSEKSNKPLEEIKTLVKILETKEASAVTEQTITDVAKKQRAFYKDVGIIAETVEERVKKREMVFRRGLILPSIAIFLGIMAILYGVYLLVQAKGVGITLWPIGITLLSWGITRISNPYLVVRENELIYYNELGRKRVYKRSDIITINATNTGVVFTLRNNNKLVINYWDLSRFDRLQFERFISKVHTLEL